MDKKNLELNIAISLALILLAAGLVIFMRHGQKKPPSAAKGTVAMKKRNRVSKPPISIPATSIRESKETISSKKGTSGTPKQKAAKGEKERFPAVMLKDLPLDSIKPEEAPAGQTVEQATQEGVTTRSLHTQPSPKDMKGLKQKGLIIY